MDLIRYLHVEQNYCLVGLEPLTANVKVATVLGSIPASFRHSGIWGVAEETMLNKVHTKTNKKISLKIRVVDPDPHGSALIWVAGSRSVFKMRIQIKEGKNEITQKNRRRKKYSCVKLLDVLFWGLKASPIAWASFREALGTSKLQFLIKKNI